MSDLKRTASKVKLFGRARTVYVDANKAKFVKKDKKVWPLAQAKALDAKVKADKKAKAAKSKKSPSTKKSPSKKRVKRTSTKRVKRTSSAKRISSFF